jgi:hypothetical protein
VFLGRIQSRLQVARHRSRTRQRKNRSTLSQFITSTLARSVLTDSYRGIALSGLMPMPPSIIQLGGIVRFSGLF